MVRSSSSFVRMRSTSPDDIRLYKSEAQRSTIRHKNLRHYGRKFLQKDCSLVERKLYPWNFFYTESDTEFFRNRSECKTFFKSKVDEISALLLRRTENIQKAEHSVFSADHAAIMQTIEFINKNLHKKLPLETLAKMACMIPSKFKYVFKTVTGFPLTDYLVNKKMEKVCSLLLNINMYVANIAQSLG